MNKLINLFALMIIMAALIASGCATSYQDRADALAGPDEPAADESPAEEGDGSVMRYNVPLSGACIINADCVDTEFCELGRCISECSHEKPCSGNLHCSTRGKCVADGDYIDVDPALKTTPPVDWSLDEHVVRLDPGQNSAPFTIKVNSGGSMKYRVNVAPKEASDAVTVSSTEGFIGSGGQALINVTVDRAAFGDGDHRFIVNVITDGGQQAVVYEFSNGLAGRYAGFVDYMDPGLRRVPVVIDIDVDASGAVTGRVLNKGSLLFPVERSVSGYYNAAQKTFFFAAMDRYETDGTFDPFERQIGREIYFYGEISEHRVIKGAYEEIISGLLPQLMSVEGEFYLERASTEIGDVTALPEPEMPGFEFTPPEYTSCVGSSTLCQDFFPADVVGCSSELRQTAYRLGVDFVDTNVQGQEIVNFGLVEDCKADIVGNGTNACVNMTDLICLHNNQQRYIITNIAQDSEFGAYFEDLIGLQRLYAFVGNDLLVEAYRTTVQQVSSPLTLEISRLEDALDKFEEAERAFFETGNIAALGRAGANVVTADNFELFRVPLEYIRSSHTALARIASLTMRKDMEWPSKRDALRVRVQEHARVIYLEGLALARLINMHGGAFESELAQIADELRAVSHTMATLEAGLNPLGYPVDYVPFVYDPAQSQYPTNFDQLVKMANTTLTSAVQKAELAENMAELMEVRTEDIQLRMTEIEQSYESEIQQICGITDVTMLVECGVNGGELAAVYNRIEQAYIKIEMTHQQIADVYQMVKIKDQTARSISNIQNNSLTFIESSGAELEALDIAAGEIRAAMLRKSGGIFGALGGIFKGAISIAGGIVSAHAGDAWGAFGGIAGGVSGAVQSGLGAGSSTQSADATLQLAEVDRSKTHIRNLQQMVLKQENIEITALQYAEAVKMLLVEMARLNLDLQLKDIELAEHVIRANTLLQRVDMLTHHRDVLMAQALNSVNNPLSNLSFRIKRDHAVLMAANDFEKAIARVYLAARGLEHELNVDLLQIESQLMQANTAHQLQDFLTCLEGWYDDYAIAFGAPHQEVTQLSLREDILGFTEAVQDEVSGEIIQPEEIFRRVLLNPKHVTQAGAIEFPFATNISGGNKQFSTLVCNDRVKSVRVMLVGDFLGDNEAMVMLKQEGNSYLRECSADPLAGEDSTTTYHLDDRNAVIQAGVNSFGLAQASYDLAGRSVASDRWLLTIPPGSMAPANTDVDFLNIDDIVIEITHDARALNSGTPSSVFSQCNI